MHKFAIFLFGLHSCIAFSSPRPTCAALLQEEIAKQACRDLDRTGDIERIFIELNRYFEDFPGATPEGEKVPLPTAFLRRGNKLLFTLLSAWGRGIQDVMIPQNLPALHEFVLANFEIDPDHLPHFDKAIFERLEKAANDPEIFLRLYQLELNHTLSPAWSWSRLFLEPPLVSTRMPKLLEVKHPKHPDRPFYNVRPQQIMLAQAVFGNTSTRPGDKILEIGYGNPSVLSALALLLKVWTTGVDTQIVPQGMDPELSKAGMQLIQGNIPTDVTAMEAVRKRGPYKVIYAGDAIFENLPDGIQPFDPKVPPADYARTLYDLLTPTGYVVILNDFARSPNFTREEAEAAGFNVIHWGTPRHMPRLATFSMRVQFPEAPSTLGELRLHVLRKGDTDLSRIRIVKTRVQ